MRVVTLVAVAVAGVFVGAACARDDEPVTKPSDEFCRAAEKLDEGLSSGKLRVDGQIRLVRRLVDAAPAEIEPDARTFLAALERVRDERGDDVRDDPEVKEAVDAVNRYAIDGCGLLEGDAGASR